MSSLKSPVSRTKKEQLSRMIRVDHAGEYGAGYIYKGQIAALPNSDKRPMLEHMRDQELEHLAAFDKMIVQRRVRPTIMSPLWKACGFALGYVTGKMGEEAAMACTVAVEEVIDEHYAEQEKELEAFGDEEPLLETVKKFRQEELEHRDLGLEHGAEQAPGYEILTGAIKRASKAAIWISKRV